MTPIEAVIRALEEGRLTAPMNDVKGQLRASASGAPYKDPKGHLIRPSEELVALLAGLLEGNRTMTIMSLFRYGTPHGEVQSDGTAIGRCVDIMAYAGFPIHLKLPSNADNAIKGVAAVMGSLPAGKFTLGLPRPGGGASIDPDHDVFLPVTDHSQVTKSPGHGVFSKDLEKVLEPARTAMKAAVAQNPAARVQFMYPDGVDHVHVKALS